MGPGHIRFQSTFDNISHFLKKKAFWSNMGQSKIFVKEVLILKYAVFTTANICQFYRLHLRRDLRLISCQYVAYVIAAMNSRYVISAI